MQKSVSELYSDYISTTKLTNSNELVQMIMSGYIAQVKNLCKSMIHFDRLDVAEYENELMKILIRDYMVPFGDSMFDHFVVFGLMPFVLVKETIQYQNIKETFKIPKALELGSYEITTIMTKNYKKEYLIHINNVVKQPEIYLCISKYRKGPSVTWSDMCDSECGILYHEWKKLKKHEQEISMLFKRATHPPLILQKLNNQMTQQNNLENFHYSLHSAQKLDHGFPIDTVPPIQESEETNCVYIPAHYEASKFQPHLDPSFLDMTPLIHAFYSSVDLTFKMPIQSSKSDASYMHSRSRSAVDEDRAKLAASTTQMIKDIDYNLRRVFELVFDHENEASDLKIMLPHRSLIDFDNIHFLHEEGVIDDEVARDEYVYVAGINPDRATKGKLIKRVPEDGRVDPLKSAIKRRRIKTNKGPLVT